MTYLRWRLWPIVLLAFVSPAALGQSVHSVAEQYLFAAANAERSQRGLPALRWDESLEAAAAHHARWMATERRIAHQFSGEPDLASRAQAAGARFSLIEENVGESPTGASDLHLAWMNSAHHRENLLDSHVDAVAISVVRRDGWLYGVEDFARAVAPLSFAVQEDAVAAVLKRQPGSPQVLPASEDARRTCGLEEGYAGERRPLFVMRYTTDDLSRLPEPLRARLSGAGARQALVGACAPAGDPAFASYRIAVLLYP